MSRSDYFTLNASQDTQSGKWGYVWTCSWCSKDSLLIYKESGGYENTKKEALDAGERSIRFHKLSGTCLNKNWKNEEV
jgi:hypothetical protein